MSEAWRSAKIRSFEFVLAGSSDALLRVTAKPTRRYARSGSLPRPMLLTDDGTSVNRYAPLPSPADERGVLRAAFSVHPRLLSDDTVFSLFLDGGFAIMLPKPEPGQARSASASAPADGEATAAHGDDGAISPGDRANRRDEVSTKLTALTRELAEAHHETSRAEGRAARNEEELGRLRAAAAAVERERELAHQRGAAAEAQRMEAEAAQATADERVRHAAAEVEERLRSEWQAKLDIANDQAERGAAELAAVQTAIAAADQHSEELTRMLEDARAAGRDAELRTTEAQAQRDQSAAEAEQHRVARVEADQSREVATRELVEMQETMHRLGVEREELSRQATAFDDVAQKARDRATEAETQRSQATGRLQELEVWTSELERRLTEATDELATLKTGAEAGDSRTRRLQGELAESEAKVELMQAHIQALTAQLDGRRSAWDVTPPPPADAAAVAAAPPVADDEPESDEAARSAPAAPVDRMPSEALEDTPPAPVAPPAELLRAIREAAAGRAREQAVRDLAQAVSSTPL